MLDCFGKVVAIYKREQMMRVVGSDAVFRAQNGAQAVRQWCMAVLDGKDFTGIKKGNFNWEMKLLDLLTPAFKWTNGKDAKTSHGGRTVLCYNARTVPQAMVFNLLQHSKVFRMIFKKLGTPAYPHPLLAVEEDNVAQDGTPQPLEREVKHLLMVRTFDEKHQCAHVQQLGWDPVTDHEVVIPLKKCIDGKSEKMLPNAIVEVRAMLPYGWSSANPHVTEYC